MKLTEREMELQFRHEEFLGLRCLWNETAEVCKKRWDDFEMKLWKCVKKIEMPPKRDYGSVKSMKIVKMFNKVDCKV